MIHLERPRPSGKGGHRGAGRDEVFINRHCWNTYLTYAWPQATKRSRAKPQGSEWKGPRRAALAERTSTASKGKDVH